MTVSSTHWWSKATVAVVTGANKGIGYEFVRLFAEQGLTVVLTARDQSRGQAALDALKASGQLESVWFHPLDVTSLESVERLATWLKKKFGGLDILVNNAGINCYVFSYSNAKQTLDTNYYGVKNVTEGLLPLMKPSPAAARIVNVSSRLGLYGRLRSEKLRKTFGGEEKYSKELIDWLATKYLEDVRSDRWDEEGWIERGANAVPMYSESKILMSAYAVALANSLSRLQPEDHQILVASFCPGVAQTDMLTGAFQNGYVKPDGILHKSAAEGADTGVWLALLPKDELLQKNGKFYAERMEYDFGSGSSPF